VVKPCDFVVLSVAAFVMGFILLIGALVFQLKGVTGSSVLTLIGLAFNYIGVIAAWSCRNLKAQTERFERLESQLSAQQRA
jgi:hypothetical protein